MNTLVSRLDPLSRDDSEAAHHFLLMIDGGSQHNIAHYQVRLLDPVLGSQPFQPSL